MRDNDVPSPIKGKRVGACPDCNLDRGDWEPKGSKCGRCGHTFQTDIATEPDTGI